MSSPKELIRKLDKALLGGALTRHRYKTRQRELEHLRTFDPGEKWIVYTRANPSDLIAHLCDKYGSDKGSITNAGPYPWRAHSYAGYYSNLLLQCRHSIKRVFECGLGTNNPDVQSNMSATGKPGASLRVWRDYFPNAQVIGADIDERVLFQEERIQTFHLDQTKPASIQALWRKCGAAKFDLMIDDGLHTFDAGKCLFENSIQQLASNGIYIIEDVFQENMARYKSYFDATECKVDLVTLYQPGDDQFGDNGLVVIRQGGSQTT